MSYDPDARKTNADELAEMLAAKLRTIVKVKGYRTNIGNRVFEGRRDIPEPAVPCCLLVESDERSLDDNTKGQGSPKVAKVASHYIVEGFAFVEEADRPNATIRSIVKDIKRCIFADDPVLRSKISALRYAGRGIGTREDGTSIVSGYVEFDIEWVEDLQAP